MDTLRDKNQLEHLREEGNPLEKMGRRQPGDAYAGRRQVLLTGQHRLQAAAG